MRQGVATTRSVTVEAFFADGAIESVPSSFVSRLDALDFAHYAQLNHVFEDGTVFSVQVFPKLICSFLHCEFEVCDPLDLIEVIDAESRQRRRLIRELSRFTLGPPVIHSDPLCEAVL